MVQVFQDQPSFASRLAGGATNAAGEFGKAFLEEKLAQRQGKMQDEALKRLTGKDLSGLSPQMKQIFFEKFAQTPNNEKLVQSLIQQGVDPEEAELYSLLTQGGQTAYVKELLEQKKRSGKFSKAISNSNSFQQQNIENNLSPQQQVDLELDEILSTQDQGLTPAEKVKRGKERFDTGYKEYKEADSRLRGLTRDKERLDLLEGLNKSKKLPQDLGRLNVRADGTLRAPFLASEQAQQYVKILNEFSAGAKDTFGSRVTNFDLQQYMQRYPNLLNSEAGRKRLIDQMKIVNQINSIHYKNLKDIYKKAGGVRNIDADQAERLAEQLSEPKINELVKKFDEIGTFTSLPNAAEFKGKKIRNRETGELMVSDGQNWQPVG